MKSKIGMFLLFLACILCACSDKNSEKQPAQPVKGNVSELYQERPGDSDYFMPISDDYIYIVGVQTDELEIVELMSFDSEGNMVQYVERYVSSEFSSENPHEATDFDVDEDCFVQLDDVIYIDVFKGTGDSFAREELMQSLKDGIREYIAYYVSQNKDGDRE